MSEKTPAEWRKEFLLQMYGELWNNINRHLTVSWQSVSVLGGSIAIFALVEKNILSIDFASAAVLIICFWLMATAYEASGWFNRNLAIITNIEKHFLTTQDLTEVHPFFKEHRRPESMTGHIRVQFVLAVIVALLVVLRHFVMQIWPGIGGPWSSFQAQKLVPYLVLVIGIISVWVVRQNVTSDQRKLLKECPGKELRTDLDSTAN